MTDSSGDPLDRAAVTRAAELARLQLTPDAADRLPGEFERILGWFRKMEQLDVSGIEPLIGNPLAEEDVLREDLPRGDFPRESLLANAPERGGEEAEFYAVPRTIQESKN